MSNYSQRNFESLRLEVLRNEARLEKLKKEAKEIRQQAKNIADQMLDTESLLATYTEEMAMEVRNAEIEAHEENSKRKLVMAERDSTDPAYQLIRNTFVDLCLEYKENGQRAKFQPQRYSDLFDCIYISVIADSIEARLLHINKNMKELVEYGVKGL